MKKRYTLEQIIRCMGEGGEEVKQTDALDAYLLELGEEVLGILKKKGFTKEDAEDAVQTTFYKIYTLLPSIQEDTLRPWFFRVALNDAIDLYRKQNRFQSLTIDIPQEDPAMEKTIADKETLQHLLEPLSKENQELLLLKYYYGFPLNEIGEFLHIKPESVKTQLFRLRKKIKESREKNGFNKGTEKS